MVPLAGSNSLDEHIIDALLVQGAKVDAFGVGERMITHLDPGMRHGAAGRGMIQLVGEGAGCPGTACNIGCPRSRGYLCSAGGDPGFSQ